VTLWGRLAAAAATALVLAGCATAVQKVIEHGEGIINTARALRKGFENLTPSEEHYLGRAVSAHMLGIYPLREDEKRTRYLNRVGGLLARASSRPETFGGYHFALVESPEVNAFAAPGGFIVVTTGLFGLCRSEEQLAAVLAHEVAHTTLQHGLKAIKSSHLTEAFTILGGEVAKEYTPAEISKLTEVFAGSIDDIVNRLVESGYSRDQEYEADAEALRIARRAGYDPRGMTEFLAALSARTADGGDKGFFRTHPPAKDRLGKVEEALGAGRGTADAARTKRFAQFAL